MMASRSWPSSPNSSAASSANAPATPSPSRKPPASASADPQSSAPACSSGSAHNTPAPPAGLPVARALNADGVPTAHGGMRWYPATIRYLMFSPTARAS